jgi:hypothetical protein
MRTKLRSKLSLLFMTFGLLLAIPAVALADNVVDDVADDVTTGRTITAGDSGTTVNYRIVANSGDGQDRCNAEDGSPATVNINVGPINGSDPSKVTASPNSLQFNYCGTPNKQVTYTATKAGDYAITVTVADSGVGGYNTNPAAFTLHVNAPADTTPPVITPDIQGTLGNNGWYTSNVTLSWNVTDGQSNISSQSGCGTVNITSDQQATTYTCTATSAGGTSSESVTIKRDATRPNVAFVGGGISGGASYDFGEVPAAPTCSASDETSGLASPCDVTGYSEAVGSHTLKATATDNAGNEAIITRGYTVLAWTLSGFYQPVDMNDTVNIVKNGSTVPVKFELFQFISGTELQSTSAVSSILAKQVNCAAFNGDPIDEIETLATGGTSLRYDTVGGQFIYNWQTPKGASQVGKCYSLTMTAADSSQLVAYFKLK